MISSHAHKKDVASLVPRQFRSVFPFTHFNHMQSVVCESILQSDENMVIAAPTGSGKTVLHELAICRVLQQRQNHPVRCIYIAPSKALCQQRWREWFEKFSPLHQTVLELTGDVDIRDSLVSIAKASIVITTPEKWDSITRTWRDHIYLMSNIDLLLLDEVHHLGEDRGPTLEAVIVRMQYLASFNHGNPRTQSQLNHRLRIIGLSATLPNLSDIGEWLKCTPRNIHYFDDTFRPVPLEIHTLNYGPAPNPFLFERSLDSKVYDVIRKFGNNRQALVFCSSKKNTENVAEKLYRVRAVGGILPSVVCHAIHQHGISDKKLLDLIQHGIAYHHAGLLPDDRTAVEDLYRLGHIRILCSTSTLAHGINLPAFLVVVKGTFCWRGSINGYEKLRRSDIVQMIGRAGRAGFDTTGVAVVMTNQEDLARYSNLTLGMERVQSQLINNINEAISAEISQRVITSVNDCISWLKTTFLYICFKQRQQSETTSRDDQITELASRTISTLENAHLILTDKEGRITPYVECHIMAKTTTKLKSAILLMNISADSGIKELISIISQCQEMHRPVRRDEKKFLNDCKQQIRFFFPERVQTPEKKSVVLLQAAIGRVPIKDFTLRVEQAEIVENAIRLLKCLFELALCRSQGQLMESTILLDRALKLRLWETFNQNIFHQCKGISETTLSKISNLNKLSVFDFFGMNIHAVETELSCSQEEARSLLQFSSDMIGAKLSMTVGEVDGNMILHINPAVPTNYRNISPFIKYQLLCYCSVSKELLCYRSLPAGTLNQIVQVPNSNNIPLENIRCSLVGNVAGIDFSIGPSRTEPYITTRTTNMRQENHDAEIKASKREQPANRSNKTKGKQTKITPINPPDTQSNDAPTPMTPGKDSLREISCIQPRNVTINSPQNSSSPISIANKKIDFSKYAYQSPVNPSFVFPQKKREPAQINKYADACLDIKENLSDNIIAKTEDVSSSNTFQFQSPIHIPQMYKRKVEEFSIRGDIKRIKGIKSERCIREPFSSKTSATISRGASSRFFDDSSISTESTLPVYQSKENQNETFIEFPTLPENNTPPITTKSNILAPQNMSDVQHVRSPLALESMQNKYTNILSPHKQTSNKIDFDDAFL